jgi:hypothetical protein
MCFKRKLERLNLNAEDFEDLSRLPPAATERRCLASGGCRSSVRSGIFVEMIPLKSQAPSGQHILFLFPMMSLLTELELFLHCTTTKMSLLRCWNNCIPTIDSLAPAHSAYGLCPAMRYKFLLPFPKRLKCHVRYKIRQQAVGRCCRAALIFGLRSTTALPLLLLHIGSGCLHTATTCVGPPLAVAVRHIYP